MEISPQEFVELARLLKMPGQEAAASRLLRKGEENAPFSKSVQRPSEKEMRKRIIDLLKSTYMREGFGMEEAAQVVSDKLHRRVTTTRNAVNWARSKGIILQKGRGHYFTEFIQERVAAKLQEQVGTTEIGPQLQAQQVSVPAPGN